MTKYIANPVVVEALRILKVEDQVYQENFLTGNVLLTLEDGTRFIASAAMTARHTPVPGDYLVTQSDGYQYLNPKDVFERKYRLPHPLSAQLDESLSYHRPDAEQLARIEKLRAAQKAYAAVLEELCPAGRPLSIAKTEFETHAMWAVKAIVIGAPKG